MQTKIEWRREEEIPEEEKEDVDVEDSESEDELQVSEREALQELRDIGCLMGKAGPTLACGDVDIARAAEARDMRALARAVETIRRGIRRQEKGMAELSAVISRRPELAPLAAVLQPYRDLVAVAPSQPQLMTTALDLLRPGLQISAKRLSKSEYACSMCDQRFKSWGKCRSHIRAAHTGGFLECEKCGATSINDDSMAKHRKKCQGPVAKAEGAATPLGDNPPAESGVAPGADA